MENVIFVLCISTGIFFLFRYAFHLLPQERWQILAVLPHQKVSQHQWNGVNLTYYGLFVATAVTVAVGHFMVLLGSIGISMTKMVLLTSILLSFCIPASKILAKWIEKKFSTFTIGGASFVGIILAPVVLLGINTWVPGESFPILPTLSALLISFALGEGIGRLGCISFGCCYGKPLSLCSPILQKLFHNFHFRFSGETKKVVYEGKLESTPVLPIQGMTATIYSVAFLTGLICFLNGWFGIGLMTTTLMTQIWRVLSEYWRADYRGDRAFSAYQVMALIGCVYLFLVSWLLSTPFSITPNILNGLEGVWDPGAFVFLQILWIGIFLFMGRSKVTSSMLSIYVHRDRV